MKIFFLCVCILLVCIGMPLQPAQASEKVPVVIVPGILASWNWGLFVGQGLPDAWDFTLGDETYDPIIESFEDAGYERDQDLFVAFYDWRQSNRETYRDYLMPVIDEALAKNPEADWVDIVAHSMGGLMTRAYLQGGDNRDDVRNFIMLATPNYGAADSYYMWSGGRFSPQMAPREKRAANIFLFYRGLTYAPPQYSRKDIIRTDMPAVQELLPTYDFLVDVTTGLDLPVAGMEAQNPLLPELNQGGPYGAPSLEDEVDQLTVIAGRGKETIQRIAVEQVGFGDRWLDGRPIDGAVAYGMTGDGTVLGTSAMLPVLRPNLDCFPDEPPVLSWLVPSARACEMVKLVYGAETTPGWSNTTQRYIDGAGHRDIVTKAIPMVHEVIRNSQNGLREYEAPNEEEDVLGFLIASPVDPTIITPSGKRLGLNENDIGEHAEVWSAGDETGPKVLLIENPEAGTYQFEGIGTGNGGEYHVGVLRFHPGESEPIGASEDTPIPTVAGTITPGETTTLEVESLGQGLVVDGVVYGELPVSGPAAGPRERINQLRLRVAQLAEVDEIQPGLARILKRSYESRVMQLNAAREYESRGHHARRDFTLTGVRHQLVAQKTYLEYMARIRQITPTALAEILDLTDRAAAELAD